MDLSAAVAAFRVHEYTMVADDAHVLEGLYLIEEVAGVCCRVNEISSPAVCWSLRRQMVGKNSEMSSRLSSPPSCIGSFTSRLWLCTPSGLGSLVVTVGVVNALLQLPCRCRSPSEECC